MAAVTGTSGAAVSPGTVAEHRHGRLRIDNRIEAARADSQRR
ncbi:hypothetical protein NJ7G_2233 [Natrinema sp. J7-2]|nr:hypothetical protein NJ7G_2233 [Natrinema sp. J7-2]